MRGAFRPERKPALQIGAVLLPRDNAGQATDDPLASALFDIEHVTNVFYVDHWITVTQDGQEIEIDSRPSDAIALAIRAEAPIFAADDVIEESAIEFEGEEVTEEEIESRVSEFKQFLDEVTPDEFAIEPEEE